MGDALSSELLGFLNKRRERFKTGHLDHVGTEWWRGKEEVGGGEANPTHQGGRTMKTGVLLFLGFSWFRCCLCWGALVPSSFELNLLVLGLLNPLRLLSLIPWPLLSSVP